MMDARRAGEADRSAVVVGAGITGVAAAEWLRRDGWRVTLIDRVAPGDPGQASYGNAGLIARASIVPVATPGLLAHALPMLLDRDAPLFLRWRHLPRLMPWLIPFLRSGREAEVRRIATQLAWLLGDAVDQHDALARGTGAARLIARGDYLVLYRDRAAFAKDALGFGLRRDAGIGWAELDRAALLARDPALSPAYGFAAAIPDHAWLTSPGAYVAALAAHFAREGGAVRRAEVRAIAPDGAVTLDGGETLRPARTVLAAGVWSRRFAEALGHAVPMEAERGYHLMLHGAVHRPASPMMLTDAKVVATPMDGGLRLAGVTEFAGIDAPPSSAPERLLRRVAARLHPGQTWDRAEVWMGRRPSLTDSLPMLGVSARAPSVVFAFGGQHVGMTVGPRLGRLAAEIAAGRTPNADLSALAPGRFDRDGPGRNR